MIFATVGTQLPFPRLIDTLDRLATDLGEEVIAQAGDTGGAWQNIDIRTTLEPDEFNRIFVAARVIVSHAGVGTILSARRFGKPLIILPRRHDLNEHRNDHQLATAKQVETQPGIYVAWDTDDLEALLRRTDLAPATETNSPARDALLQRLKTFIAQA